MDTESALAGYRALDLTDEKGFLCGRILGDLGVDVIKIEKPGGDPARRIGPFYDNRLDCQAGFYWWAFNANKRGITLNIDTQDGQQIFKRLVKTADFVIESFSPGYLESLHLAYEDLGQINPRIILTSITPFGQTGPKADFKVCDMICWASGGAMYCCGEPDRPPLQLIFPQAYLHAGADAAVASLITHYYREVSGEGQQVDVSIQESVIAVLEGTQEMWALNKFDFVRTGAAWAFPHPDGGTVRQQFGFPCKDGWVVCYTLGGSNIASTKHLESLIQWIDEEVVAPEWLKSFDWVHDYQTQNLTQEKINEVEGAITDFLMTKTKKELYDEALKRRLVLAPVCSPEDIVESEQLQARDFWQSVEHPELGESLTYCGPWAILSETPLKIRRRAPLIGEHNEEIYIKELRISQSDMLWLRQAGII